MDNHFRQFLDIYLGVWKNSSLSELKGIIAKDYQAREITDGKVEDFGYEESIFGWEQGFHFVNESGAKWDLQEVSVLPLRENEWMAIILAALVFEGKKYDKANMFFQTFKIDGNNEWKLVRSYIEAGIPVV